MLTPSRIHLFQGFGVELEYMIVDEATLAVKPICDELLKQVIGHYDSDYENGMITWCNELVTHVVELKSTHPELNLNSLQVAFNENILRINNLLHTWNARLLPTAMHPFMDPLKEVRIWPHENNEIYEKYNEIFDCTGHGWSNLQSTHLNLPFYDDEEFAKLHAAIRILLPIIPALCASSPLTEGSPTGTRDTRMKYYKRNQHKIPSITGRVIPEAIFSKRNYIQAIYDRIKADMAPFDPQQILNPIWVNSRGAIARFDRGSIEIRVMDVQECVAADLCITNLVVETIKALINGAFADIEVQMNFKTDPLAHLLDASIENAEQAEVNDRSYLDLFGISRASITMGELWQLIAQRLERNGQSLAQWSPELKILFEEGSLSTRIMKSLGGDNSRERITEVYRRLSDCLAQDKLFIP